MGIRDQEEIALGLGYGRVWTSQQLEEIDSIVKSQWEIREKYWLDRLLEQNFRKCIFLIGSEHMNSFCSLLKHNGIEIKIIEKKWQP